MKKQQNVRFLWSVLPLLAQLITSPSAHADEIQDDRLRFVEIVSDECDKLDGKLIALQNIDPEKSLEVWLERWVSGVVTSVQRKYTLPPNKEPMPLGCSVIAEGDQHWKVTGVEFIKQ